MTSLDEGRLLAYLDGELAADERSEVERRLASDPSARRLLETLRARHDVVREALAKVDVEPPTERVRAALAAERTATASTLRRPPSTSWWARRSRMAQAALLLLILAGGASAALPGSPLRAWLSEVFGETGRVALETPDGATEADTPAADEVGVGVLPYEGRVEIVLDSVPLGAEVRVRVVEADRASVYGPPGTRFRSRTGRVRAVAPAGPVRVDLPAAAVGALLRVNGRIYMRKEGARLDLPGPSTDSSAAEIRFRTGG